MDEQDFMPGPIIFAEGPPSPVILRRPAFKVRVIGHGIDVSLAVMCAEDIEIVEKLLVKMRASLSAGGGGADQG